MYCVVRQQFAVKAFIPLWGKEETPRRRPVRRDRPDLDEAERVPFEVHANLRGIFAFDEGLSGAVDHQSRPGTFRRAITIGAALSVKRLGDPLGRGDLSRRPWDDDTSDATSGRRRDILDAMP